MSNKIGMAVGDDAAAAVAFVADEPLDQQLGGAAYFRLADELLQQLNLGRGIDQLLESVYDQLAGLIPYNRIAVAVIDDQPLRLRLIACRSDGEVSLRIGYAARLEGSTLGPLIESGQARIINDLQAYHHHKPQSSSTRLILSEGMRSNLTLPLIADGRPIGVVFFSSRQRHAYTRQHAALLRRLAGHFAISVEKAHWATELQQTNDQLAEANLVKDRFLEVLRQEVQRQTEQLRQSEQRYRLLVRLGQLVASSLNVRDVFAKAATELRRLIGCDWTNLHLTEAVEGENRSLLIRFDQHGAPLWSERESDAASEAPQRLVVLSQGRLGRWPLVARGRSLGWLEIGSDRPEAAESWDLDLLGELAGQLAGAIDNAAAYGKIDRLKRQVEQQNVYLREEIRSDHSFGDIIGSSQPMRQVRQAIRQVADTDATVLVLGETGTGKELIARAIHDASPRREELMVKVNCAALAPTLVTSELFGHESGSFTGATRQRIGRFELAQGGTIFLDEISEVPAETQVMLLRVLQERVFERVGGNTPIEVDTRVIAATNRDLKTHSDQGHFRSDLFYRLNVFPIRVPPLRERKEDIVPLLDHFVQRFSERMNKQLTRVPRRTLDLLMRYDWPGNVRELENLVERGTIVSDGQTLVIDPSWLHGAGPIGATSSAGLSSAAGQPGAAAIPPLAETQRRAILEALAACDGKVYGPGGTAALLGVKPTTLYGKMKKLGIKLQRQASD